ncbi:hypothetical protein F6V30_03720 [Oryzomonas sagensis]|uniref:Uncharacterized protein n=1 Tax=Oryzomonas sagensis TaxID=2603857 RepID=A0ABQ6TSK9_9BACT|nr:hypothetical protein [Oryzomonas sagensis]KAB0671697.1 hypothetical protein F6V30_03720 [Oryzomonas sagensis]
MALTKDLNNKIHRIESSAAVFQKGIYHLFLLSNKAEIDIYSTIIRKYQVLFQLCLACYLLDFNANIEVKNINKRLKKFCKDPNSPTGEELDPAATVTHSIFENGNWPNKIGSTLYTTSKTSVTLISKVVNARHNLIYRPFLLHKDKMHWGDCTLIDLLKEVPNTTDIMAVYEQFIAEVFQYQAIEISDQKKILEALNKNPREFSSILGKGDQKWADYFVQLQFWPFADKGSKRPTETLLITYARMLNPNNDQILSDLRKFRNNFLQIEKIVPLMNLNPSWRVGEI